MNNRAVGAILALVCAGTTRAQIFSLATNSDGSDLYFTSSLTQQGSQHTGPIIPTSKVFRLRGGALTLVDEGEPDGSVLRGRAFGRVGLNGSGTVRAVNWRTPCQSLSGCIFREFAGTDILTPKGRLGFGALASPSANGRYVLLYGNTNPVPQAMLSASGARLLDLASGQVSLLGLQAAHDGQMVADDGSALIATPGGIRLVGAGRDVELQPARAMTRALLSADAARVVYESETPSEVRVLEIGTGLDRSLGPGRLPMLAQDGRLVSYLSPENGSTQIWLADALTGVSRQLSHEPEGIADQTLTGNGATVFASTQSGRLLSMATAGGEVTQLLGSPGPQARLLAAVVPGSYNEVIGNFAAGDPAPDVRVGDSRVVMLGRTAQGFAFQVPWDIEPGPTPTSIASAEPAWERLRLSLGVVKTAGQLLAAPIHGDWSGFVTPENRARPGEIVHMYGTGYGPVDGVVPLGQPTPGGRLFPIATKCDWRAIGVYTDPGRFEVLFAGLAPGLAGVYQLSFRIPADWPYPLFNAYCEISDYEALRTAAIDVKP